MRPCTAGADKRALRRRARARACACLVAQLVALKVAHWSPIAIPVHQLELRLLIPANTRRIRSQVRGKSGAASACHMSSPHVCMRGSSPHAHNPTPRAWPLPAASIRCRHAHAPTPRAWPATASSQHSLSVPSITMLCQQYMAQVQCFSHCMCARLPPLATPATRPRESSALSSTTHWPPPSQPLAEQPANACPCMRWRRGHESARGGGGSSHLVGAATAMAAPTPSSVVVDHRHVDHRRAPLQDDTQKKVKSTVAGLAEHRKKRPPRGEILQDSSVRVQGDPNKEREASSPLTGYGGGKNISS